MFADTSAALLFSATMTRSLSTSACVGDGLDRDVGEPVGSAAAVADGLEPEGGEPVDSAVAVGSVAASPGTRSSSPAHAGRANSRPVRAARIARTLLRASLVTGVVKEGIFRRLSVLDSRG